MRIQVPRRFVHAGSLSPKYASTDPRDLHYVDIDMRRCEFVQPAAVLGCAVYSLLGAIGKGGCTLLVPENMGVSVYLKSTGLFSVLQKAGVEVDDRGVQIRQDHQIILPLARFSTEAEVESLSNQTLDTLNTSKLGAVNLHPFVSNVFAELANNAVQHSESEIGALGLIQFYESGDSRRFICVVADGGIGIRQSLERNPELKERVPYDWVAIELALRERVSGTGHPTRGIGLSWIADDMRKPGRQLTIHSGLGALFINENTESESRRVTLFPGTLAFASIST